MKKEENILIPKQRVLKMIILLTLILGGLKTNAQGLQFNSNDSLLSKRTSYNVFKYDVPTFHNDLLISFDLSLWDIEHLGYILNIVDGKNNSYSLSSVFINNTLYLNFSIDSKSNKISIPLSMSQLKKRKWINAKVDLNLNKNTVGVFINDKWYQAGGFNFQTSLAPTLYFGKNERYFDVPKMAIKALNISDSEKSYYFPLNEWTGDKVLSSDGKVYGLVENPVWLINESYFWTPKLFQHFNKVAGVNYDSSTQKLLIFKSDSLLSYQLQSNHLSKQACINPCPLRLLLGKSIMNAQKIELCAYETFKTTNRAPSIACLDLKTLKWNKKGYGTIAEQRHHHNLFYDKSQHHLYLFGGYGSFSYYNDFFRYNELSDTWDKVTFTGSPINPRFFSGFSTADDNDDVYIFGGYGNESGKQVVGGKHFYDLYRINLNNHTIKKCWEIKPPALDFVAANNLILSKDKLCFFALCYAHDKPRTTLHLYKFSIKDGAYEIVSGPIPAKGERIESDINLFYDQQQETFVSTIQEFTSPEISTIRVYSLASPPVRESDYLASQHRESFYHKYAKYMYSIIAFLIAMVAGVIYFLQKKAVGSAKKNSNTDTPITNISTAEDVHQTNAIYMLGEFTVYDKNSRDITHLFSPKIRQLFILILFGSKKDGGVTSKKISATLWPDKDIAKTKNIKGVTINHLRNIINDIQGMELAFMNDTYSIILQEGVFLDYYFLTETIKQLNIPGKSTNQSILDMFSLISRGPLLPSISEPWLDDIKIYFEESLVELMLPEVKSIYEKEEYKRALEITRFILTIDPFNDIAIKYRLKAFRRIKGIAFARQQYENFTADYEKSMATTYPIPFERICASK